MSSVSQQRQHRISADMNMIMRVQIMGCAKNQIVANSVTTFTNEDIGLQLSTTRCSEIEVSSSPAGGYIECTLTGNPKIVGGNIRLDRDADGFWTCSTTAAAKYKPAGCS